MILEIPTMTAFPRRRGGRPRDSFADVAEGVRWSLAPLSYRRDGPSSRGALDTERTSGNSSAPSTGRKASSALKRTKCNDQSQNIRDLLH